MFKYLQAFLPFIIGIHEDLFENGKCNLEDLEDCVFIIYIKKGTIDISFNLNDKKANYKHYIKKKLPKLPLDLENYLTEELKIIKKSIDFKNKHKNKTKLSDAMIDIKLKNIFIQGFIEILYDYSKYLTLVDRCPIFNVSELVKNRHKKDSLFYEEFTETQLFLLFIQNMLKEGPKGYFYKRLKNFTSVKDTRKKKKDYENEIFGYLKTQTCYIIKPYFIELNQFSDFQSMKAILDEKYERDTKCLDEMGIHKSDHRIVSYLFKLNEIEFKKNTYNYNFIKGQRLVTKPLEKEKNRNTLKNRIFFEKTAKKNKQITQTILRRGSYQLSDEDKEDIKESIKEILSKAFRGDEIDLNKDKSHILKRINNSFGREFFIEQIYQGRNPEKTVKTVGASCFKFLVDVIYNCFILVLQLDSIEQKLKYVMQLLKASMLYCKQEKKKIFFINDEIFNKLAKESFMTEICLWERWVEFDLRLDDDNQSKKIDLKLSDKIVFESLKGIINILKMMKISKGTITNMVKEITVRKINEEEMVKRIKKEAKSLLKEYKC